MTDSLVDMDLSFSLDGFGGPVAALASLFSFGGLVLIVLIDIVFSIGLHDELFSLGASKLAAIGTAAVFGDGNTGL